MTTLATITVNAPTTPLRTRAQETALIARACELAAVAVRSAGGATTSGNIVDTGATVIGTFSYVPVASS
jgi:hypothetical protein